MAKKHYSPAQPKPKTTKIKAIINTTQLLDLARLSQYVYDDTKNFLPLGWVKFEDSDQYNLGKTGYFGVSVINHTSKEIVIVSSGSNKKAEHGKHDQELDIKSETMFHNGKIPTQFTNSAKPFTEKTISKLKDKTSQGYKIIFTGDERLGAGLAELSKAYMDQKNIASEAITFNGTGSLTVIQALNHSKNLPNQLTKVSTYIMATEAEQPCSIFAGEVYKVNAARQKDQYAIDQMIKTIAEHNQDHFMLHPYSASAAHKACKIQNMGEFDYHTSVLNLLSGHGDQDHFSSIFNP